MKRVLVSMWSNRFLFAEHWSVESQLVYMRFSRVSGEKEILKLPHSGTDSQLEQLISQRTISCEWQYLMILCMARHVVDMCFGNSN